VVWQFLVAVSEEWDESALGAAVTLGVFLALSEVASTPPPVGGWGRVRPHRVGGDRCSPGGGEMIGEVAPVNIEGDPRTRSTHSALAGRSRCSCRPRVGCQHGAQEDTDRSGDQEDAQLTRLTFVGEAPVRAERESREFPRSPRRGKPRAIACQGAGRMAAELTQTPVP
jgi:hypothetical protein